MWRSSLLGVTPSGAYRCQARVRLCDSFSSRGAGSSSQARLHGTRTGARHGYDSGTNLSLEPERVDRLRARRDEHALRLEIELERLQAELATEAGLLVAPERDARKGRIRHVDPDGAGLDAACDAVAARGIAVTTGPKISSCATDIGLSTPASTVGG